jgi:hypothetical protein
MRVFKNAFIIIRQNWRAYLTVNLVYYGLVVVGMVIVAFHPEIQKHLLGGVRQELSSGPLAPVASAYKDGHLLQAILWTFFVNLLLGSLLTITVPSLVVPFSGFVLGMFRAVMWGLLLAPVDPSLRGGMIPHSLTLLLEGQAYILALFASYAHGKAFLWPRSVGQPTHAHGYLLGFSDTASLYAIITPTLAVAAIYEAFEVIYLVPLFK